MTDLKRLQRWIKDQIDTCEYNMRKFESQHLIDCWKAEIAGYRTVLNKIEEMLNEEE
jgi:hypothetical protein